MCVCVRALDNQANLASAYMPKMRCTSRNSSHLERERERDRDGFVALKLTGNFDECVRNDTDDTDVCVSLIVMPGIWASEYALPLLLLLSFNGAGGILYGGLGIFVLSMSTAIVDDVNTVNLVFGAVDGGAANDVENDDVDVDSSDNDNGVAGDDGVDVID